MSRFYYVDKTEDFEVWKFEPDLVHAFPFYMERVALPWRIRCIMEFFVGYVVYYIKKENEWAGYCVVSSGSNPRYDFSSDKDIIYGRYFIAEKFRGQHLAVKMLKKVLDNCESNYEKAFAYLRVSNIPSVKTMEKIGATKIKQFDIKGKLRKLQDNPDGEFVLYRYMKGKIL